jgi:hypothetical protein
MWFGGPDGLQDGLTVVAAVMSTGGWMVKMIERRLRRRILQTKKGLQQ